MHDVNPGITVVELSARTGAGMDEWLALLERRIAEKSGSREPAAL
jgi:Ni2+-binding GTPase involved in maturation of urease and hydrogenase